MASRWLRTLLLLAILLLGRPLAVLPLGTDGGATSSDEKGEALAARLRRLLDGVRDVGQQLRSTGGAWLAARADALDAAASEGEFRGPLAFAGQRLREELRQRCSKPSFTPPTDRPATVAGAGAWAAPACPWP
ncbi:hypothetical protein HYH03_003099 [Edaphochlamys debaryana]|uniref:Uncharacterized protein n=1 Tax=Edaphochlamys debaryana TaxID=47281 RepID=A0A835YCT4_9CHLO|nr:hypothetical protein HYH03_003099 [Edaphochlamys debaryana]|eukprot:KAG2498908.1 hypothetical protein HYH03_003099 [Edaphochlamys debaryana]